MRWLTSRDYFASGLVVRPRTGRDRGRSTADEHLAASAASDAEAGASCWGGRIIGYSVTVALNYIARGSFKSVRALHSSFAFPNAYFGREGEGRERHRRFIERGGRWEKVGGSNDHQTYGVWRRARSGRVCIRTLLTLYPEPLFIPFILAICIFVECYTRGVQRSKSAFRAQSFITSNATLQTVRPEPSTWTTVVSAIWILIKKKKRACLDGSVGA